MTVRSESSEKSQAPLVDRADEGSASTRNTLPPSVRPGKISALADEVRSHAVGYSVLAAFMLAGPLVSHLIFPQAPLGVALIGGVAFGVCATVCAVPEKFL